MNVLFLDFFFWIFQMNTVIGSYLWQTHSLIKFSFKHKEITDLQKLKCGLRYGTGGEGIRVQYNNISGILISIKKPEFLILHIYDIIYMIQMIQIKRFVRVEKSMKSMYIHIYTSYMYTQYHNRYNDIFLYSWIKIYYWYHFVF